MQFEIVAFLFGVCIGWLCCYLMRELSNPLDIDFDIERLDFLQTAKCEVFYTELGWYVTNHAEVSNKVGAPDLRTAVDNARKGAGWL